MEAIFISLGLGVVIGFLRPLTGAEGKIMYRMTLAGLFLLLAVMGAQLGVNEDILANLGSIGYKAVVLAGFAVAGSILAVHLFFLWLDPEGYKRKTATHSKESSCQ